MRRKDPLIIGGGPAGSSAAIALASAGAKPLLLEASRETGDALCGGFLSWRTLQSLSTLGVTPEELGGHQVRRVRLMCGRSSVEAYLPAGAVGVSRRRLDSFLLDRAGKAGATIERGVQAASLDNSTITLRDGRQLEAESLFIATGKHDLRGLGRPRQEKAAVGLRVRLSPHPALTTMIGDAVELHLFEGGYAGLLLQEDGSANLCLALRKGRLAGEGGDPGQLIRALGEANPLLGDRIAHMGFPPTIDAIGAVPYGWIARETRPGLFRLGDQAACIPSLAGEGNGLAIASGARAAAAWLKGGASAADGFQRQFAAASARPVGFAKLLWHWAERPALAPGMIGAVSLVPKLAQLAANLTRIKD